MPKEEAKLPEGITIIPPDRESIAYESVLNLNFYKKSAAFSGSIRGMRYRLIKDEVKEKLNDTDEEIVSETRFKLSIWAEPFSYEDTAAEEIRDYFFEFSEDGRLKAVDKINEVYKNEALHWHDAEEHGIRRKLNENKDYGTFRN